MQQNCRKKLTNGTVQNDNLLPDISNGSLTEYCRVWRKHNWIILQNICWRKITVVKNGSVINKNLCFPLLTTQGIKFLPRQFANRIVWGGWDETVTKFLTILPPLFNLLHISNHQRTICRWISFQRLWHHERFSLHKNGHDYYDPVHLKKQITQYNAQRFSRTSLQNNGLNKWKVVACNNLLIDIRTKLITIITGCRRSRNAITQYKAKAACCRVTPGSSSNWGHVSSKVAANAGWPNLGKKRPLRPSWNLSAGKHTDQIKPPQQMRS